MAGEIHALTLDRSDPVWGLLFELGEATPAESWVLVGGAMVKLHAVRAGIDSTRLTTDIDALLNLGTRSIGETAGAIQALGFTPVKPQLGGEFHRFHRSSEVIDIMLSRDVIRPVTWAGRPVLKVAGGAQAIARKDTYLLRDNAGLEVPIAVPDSLGAVIAKSAAHLVDRLNRERHLQDLVTLLAATPVGQLREGQLTKKDKSYLRHLFVEIGSPRDIWWSGFSPRNVSAAQATLADLRAQM